MRLKKTKKGLNISGSQLKALQERIKNRNLAQEDWDVVLAMTETVECLAQALAEKETSIARALQIPPGAPTETARNILKAKKGHCPSSPASSIRKKPPAKGHGRNPASAYRGGEKVHIDHPALEPGDVCPGCEKGKIYELALPSVFVHITGQAPLESTVYERTRLRCNLCGEIFTPELPREPGQAKHDESAAASPSTALKSPRPTSLNPVGHPQ